MKLLDRIAVTRMLTILVGLVVSLVKIFLPRIKEDLENNPIPPLTPPPVKKRGKKNK